ncbi:acyl-ACP--UDP-N-acetylglucosamine O-acyltransferase [Synechococcus sp. Nb3U1]|uniref:acyl-ACP--UDP-N-acetylglucosamine O-acyltransferase n=1 Tax=Synechococcus sp. Nb3U1 TaxID=1914529 RepID=UPI001F2B29C3|nr:acyl-ACP--UDP-N-acetylglucosamine O-acyltransferase [Synechococcus sp. Nb3U1]MCF2971485.1 acyl-ACP--UDP-N-acetylglucosamine O-acyltransferase [Synechococcus sp. Nb3U1]
MSSLASAGSTPNSSPRIHPTAVIHPKAELHETVQVGPHTVIGEHVRIAAHTVVGANVVIDGWTEIGEGNQIFPGAVLGTEPQDLKYSGAPSQVVIGRGNRIREFVTINRATNEGEATLIGDNNLLMAYAHVAHNCVIENQVVITNAVALAGHIHIESQARIGGMVGIHQFTRVGRLAMVGAMSRIDRDVPPYMLAEGHPARIRGLNLVGLRRAKSMEGSLPLLREAYRLLYRSGLPLEKALQTLRNSNSLRSVKGKDLVDEAGSLQHLLQFLEDSLSQPQRRGPLPVLRKGSQGASEMDGLEMDDKGNA